MQIVSTVDNLHEMSKPTSGEKKKKKRKIIINLSSAALTQGVVNV